MTESGEGLQGGAHHELLRKVSAWLENEGYPVEFEAAARFRDAGFNVLQGEYTKPSDNRPRREVDVVASHTEWADDVLLRIAFVVECKWSADKPWVFFGGGRGMVPAAAAAQAIGSSLAEVLLWKEAGASNVQSLSLFAEQEHTAFGGRQALAKSRDVVFDVLRAVSSNARALADDCDFDVAEAVARNELPKHAVVMIPLVVVEGPLFAASYDGSLNLVETDAVRVQFRGAERRVAITNVDVVRAAHLRDYVHQRSKDVAVLMGVMKRAASELDKCHREHRLQDLRVTEASRGVTGLPPLLRKLMIDQRREPPPTTLRAASSGDDRERGPSDAEDST